MTTITITVDLEDERNVELVNFLTSVLGVNPIPAAKTRKPRKPMSDEEKEALKERLAKGREKAQRARDKASKPKRKKKAKTSKS